MVSVTTTLDFSRIRRLLPHGPGMVLVDRVEDLRPGVELQAVKVISGGEACYRSLGPDSPIERYAYPPSLVLESFGQAAALLWLSARPLRDDDQTLMFVAAKDCAFPGRAYPGDVLRHVVRMEHHGEGAAFVCGHTSTGSRRIASFGSLTAVVRQRAALVAPAAPAEAGDPSKKGADSHG